MSALTERLLSRRCVLCIYNISGGARRAIPSYYNVSRIRSGCGSAPANLNWGVRQFSGTRELYRKGGNKQSKRREAPSDGGSGGGSRSGGGGRDGGFARSITRGGGPRPFRKREVDIESYVGGRLDFLEKDLHTIWADELESVGLDYKQTLREWCIFRDRMIAQDFNAPEHETPAQLNVPTPTQLCRAHSVGEEVFDTLIKETFRAYAMKESEFSFAETQERLMDLRNPGEWYPETRAMQRTWIMHVGPTNSGKTYQALKRLEECETGLYAGPLRLLAHEIYERFNAKGISCNLITGEEQRLEHLNAKVTSSTVEMVDITRSVDVAVLDEIQMIGDKWRGWAWTQALLGVRAKEVHMCGEERTIDLIHNLAALTGDKLIINRYNRLGPLLTARESLNGNWNAIEKGDCVVTFSRKDIFAIKKTIEMTTGKRCAVVYGGLPPETRSQQAKLFNDHTNEYDVLVASDAVGMGLNLSIQRVVFETMTKYDGESLKALEIPHIKQIGGRAGRFKVAPTTPLKIPGHEKDTPGTIPPVGPLPAIPNPGMVTTFEKSDLKLLTYAMKANTPPIRTAGIHPPDKVIEKYAKTFGPRKPFSAVLQHLVNNAKINKDLFHLCSMDDQMRAAGVIEPTRGLTVTERITITQAPMPKQDTAVKENLLHYSRLIAESRSGSILEVENLDLELLDQYLAKQEETKQQSAGAIAEGMGRGKKAILRLQQEVAVRGANSVKEMDELRELESLHKSTMLWLWLSYRFPSVFTPRETAFNVKSMTEDVIQEILNRTTYNRARKVKSRRKAQEYLGVLMNEERMLENPWDVGPDGDLEGVKQRAEAAA